MAAYLDDDENVKAMRETARTLGITKLLLGVRREHLAVQTALERDRARVTQALILLGVSDPGEKAAPKAKNTLAETYTFVLERVDGSRLEIGSGTLDEGRTLVETIEADFVADRPVPAGYEGCNVVAVADGQDVFMFVDDWEPTEDPAK